MTKKKAGRPPASAEWMAERNHLLITNWSSMTIDELSNLLDCDTSGIRKQAHRLRALGIDLPVKTPAARPRVKTGTLAAAEPPKKIEPPLPQPSYWEDGWMIKPPSLDRLRAGK